MPKASFASRDAITGLDAVMLDIRQYLESESPGGDDFGFTKRTRQGVFIEHRAVTYPLSHYRRGTARELASTESGLYSFEELMALQLPRPEPVVEGLIYAGETVLIAGRPKVGKTRLVLQLGFSVAGGCAFLGMAVPKPRRVPIVALEDRPWAIRERLLRMSGPTQEAPGLNLWCADSLSTDVLNATPEGVARLADFIEKAQAEVLIIDPWRLWLGKDENNAEEVVKGLRALSSLRELRPGLTIIIVHHVRKERFESPRKLLADPRLWVESVSGHHALISHVDACYGLERQREDDGEEWIVFGGIARNVEPRTLLVEDDDATLRFEVSRQEAALEAVLTTAEKAIWVVAKKLERFGFNELLRQAETTNRKAAVSALKKAQGHGLVTRTGQRYEVAKAGGE